MKILILANNDVGLYQFRRDLIEALLPEHRVTLSLPYGPLVEPLKALGCAFIDTPVDRRGINFATDLRLLRRYRAMMKRENPDLVITYTIKPNIYGSLVCRMRKIPYAVNITGLGTAFQHKNSLRSLVVFLYKIALKKARVVFFENAANRQIFTEENIVPAEKCCLLHGAGVNLDHYAFAPYPEEGTTRFLFIGRMMQEKGLTELLQVMERLRAEGEDCTLDVLGHQEEDYSEAIERCTAAGWLRYHGQQSDVRPFIRQCHCFVLPSYHEGMANTNLESASMGRPLITTDIPGCREAVTKDSGLLCQSQSADSLYAAMKAFLRLSHRRRAAMGQAGRAHMEEVFDKKKVVAATISVLIR